MKNCRLHALLARRNQRSINKRRSAAFQSRGTAFAFLSIAALLCSLTTSGCSRPPVTELGDSPEHATNDDPALLPEALPEASTAPPRPEPEVEVVTSQSHQPSGRPARNAVCGHAVAFAGWRPDDAGVRDVLLINDPGDNTLAEIRHAWTSQPSELPVHFGQQRPAVVLAKGAAYTITGAVLVAPRGFNAAERDIPTSAIIAAELPDLTQHLSPKWPSLCGPTSAADVLFSMHSQAQSDMPALVRGPSEEADEGVVRLITGSLEEITHESLAGRMGGSDRGMGVTNDGIRRGLQAWLDNVAPDAWDVRLLWFDDAIGVRSRKEQREFFGKLAAAIEAGGGAIICLWPGVDFSSRRIDAEASSDAENLPPTSDALSISVSAKPHDINSEKQNAAGDVPDDAAAAGGSTLPTAEFPQLPSAQPESIDAPGRPEAIDFEQVARDATSRMATARQHLASGNADRAYEAAVEVVSKLHPATRRNTKLKPLLTEALELCRECDIERGSRAVNTEKPIEYR